MVKDINYRKFIYQIKHSQSACIYYFFLLIFIIPCELQSQEWTDPITIYYGGTNSYPDLTIDNNGRLHSVWTHVISIDHTVIYYSKSLDYGQSWSTPENISLNDDKIAGDAHIVADSSNNLYVSYIWNLFVPSQALVYYKKYDGTSWSDPLPVSAGMPGAQDNQLIIDNDNRVYFFWSYIATNAQFYYRFLENNGNWSEVLNPFEGINVTSFFKKGVMDDQNAMHVISLYKVIGQNRSYPSLNYFINDNNIWSNNVQISDCTYYPISSADISLSYNQTPGFVWQQKTHSSPFAINSTYYSKLDGGIPTPKDEISEDSHYAVFSYDLADSPKVIIVEQLTDSLFFLAYYQYLNGFWVKEILEENPIAFYAPVIIRSDSSLLLIYGKGDTIEYAINSPNTMILFRKFDLPVILPEIVQQPNIRIFPIPFNTNVSIRVDNSDHDEVSIEIFQLTGQCVYHARQLCSSGYDCEVVWDGTNDEGMSLPAGIYFARVGIDNTARCCKLIKQ